MCGELNERVGARNCQIEDGRPRLGWFTEVKARPGKAALDRFPAWSEPVGGLGGAMLTANVTFPCFRHQEMAPMLAFKRFVGF